MITQRYARHDELIKDLLSKSILTVDQTGNVFYKSVLCKSLNDKGYPVFTYTTQKATKKRRRRQAKIRLHRVVYQALKGELDRSLVVNHVDRDTTNNHPDNLELISYNANIKHWQKEKYGTITS